MWKEKRVDSFLWNLVEHLGVPAKSPRLTWSDILHQLDSFSTYCEAKTKLVLLHHHTSMDESRTWKKRRALCEEGKKKARGGFDNTKNPASQLPVASTGMSSVGSLCWVAEDLRSESPMVRLLSLVRGGGETPRFKETEQIRWVGGLTQHLLAHCEPMERLSTTRWLQFCVFYGSERHMTSD